MRKLIVLLFIGILASCSTENEELVAIEKSGNNQNGQSIYENYLNSNMTRREALTDFDNLSKADKIDVWLYKYELYKDNNSLSVEQDLIIDDLMQFVEQSAFESNLDESLIDDLERDAVAEFSESEIPYLFYSLENSPGDFSGGDVQTHGCFWCYEIVPGTESPCTATYNNDGDFTGYQFTAKVNVVRFWVITDTQDWVGISCTYSDWANDGFQ